MERTRKFKNLALASSLVLSAGIITSCSKAPRDYDILSDASEFVQNTVHTPRKVDILWVVDNSGSMKTSQENVAASFQSFIGRFQTLNYDFHMAVTTTEAYRSIYDASRAHYALLRDGNSIDGPSGYPILDNTLSDAELSEAFIKNISQGTSGSGDERAFQSIGATLSHPDNAGFHREGAFLAVIMVMDEEDYSHSNWRPYSASSGHTLHDPQMYIDFLSTVTGGLAGKDFSFNSISIDSDECRDSLITDGFQGRSVAHRARALADATDGITASLCDDFGGSLELISDSIVELSSVFALDREPKVDSIAVYINNVLIPQSEVNGWTYLPEEIAIRFHGTAVPPQGSAVRIDFDPLELKK